MLTDKEIARLLDIANAGLNRGEVAAARRVYEGVLAVHPEHVGAKLGMVLSHIAVGEYEKADALLKALLERLPEDPDVLVYLGLSAALSGRKDEARDFLARVSEGAEGARRLAEELSATL